MIDSLEDYHTCTVCARPVHDYGPGADAVCEGADWYHRSCYANIDGDILMRQLQKSIALSCKHEHSTVVDVQGTDSDSDVITFQCLNEHCGKTWTEEKSGSYMRSMQLGVGDDIGENNG